MRRRIFNAEMDNWEYGIPEWYEPDVVTEEEIAEHLELHRKYAEQEIPKHTEEKKYDECVLKFEQAIKAFKENTF